MIQKTFFDTSFIFFFFLLSFKKIFFVAQVNTGTSAILVKVQDIEDQPPEFIAMTPVARISENAKIGTSVLQGLMNIEL